MGKAIMGCAAVSADGYIAYDDGQIGSLFDWMSGGDVEWKWSESDEHAMRSTQGSEDFMQSVYTDIGAVIMGRDLFDQTNRLRMAYRPRVIMSSSLHMRRRRIGSMRTPHRSRSSPTESNRRSSRHASSAATGSSTSPLVRSAGRTGLGLIDQIVMNVVPVVFGGGRPFFGAMESGDNVTLGNPSRVAQGTVYAPALRRRTLNMDTRPAGRQTLREMTVRTLLVGLRITDPDRSLAFYRLSATPSSGPFPTPRSAP